MLGISKSSNTGVILDSNIYYFPLKLTLRPENRQRHGFQTKVKIYIFFFLKNPKSKNIKLVQEICGIPKNYNC